MNSTTTRTLTSLLQRYKPHLANNDLFGIVFERKNITFFEIRMT